MRLFAAICAFSLLVSCGPSETAEQRKKEADSAAGRAGQVAYGASKVAGKVARAAGRELDKAAHNAHEGWKEAAAKDKRK